MREGNFDAAEMAILCGIGCIVAKKIVIGDSILGPDYASIQIVIIQKCLAAGIPCEREERILL